MSFDLRGMLTAVQTMVAALPTIQSTSAAIFMVVPLSLPAKIAAIITLGPATPQDSTMGGQDWAPEVIVVFAYRLSDGDQNAELIMGDLILELVDAIIGSTGDQTIGGTIDEGRVSLDMNNATFSQLYRDLGGSDARLYPVTIRGFQQRRVG